MQLSGGPQHWPPPFVRAGVLGTPFYCMEFAAGQIYVDPNLPTLDPASRHTVYRNMATTLAQLHGVEPSAVKLTGSYGSPNAYCLRQLKRWAGQYMASVDAPMQGMLALQVGGS